MEMRTMSMPCFGEDCHINLRFMNCLQRNNCEEEKNMQKKKEWQNSHIVLKGGELFIQD